METTTINRTQHKARLYDPESGDCLNEETMKAVEDGRNGKNLFMFDTFEDYLEYVKVGSINSTYEDNEK